MTTQNTLSKYEHIDVIFFINDRFLSRRKASSHEEEWRLYHLDGRVMVYNPEAKGNTTIIKRQNTLVLYNYEWKRIAKLRAMFNSNKEYWKDHFKEYGPENYPEMFI